MKLGELKSKIKEPCAQCPYKLGLVKCVTNPCPHCKMNHFSDFERFKNLISKDNKRFPKE